MTARRYVLALDQGTTGSTALVVDPDGAVRGRGYAELPQRFPRAGWVEHDPEEIWQTTCQALARALGAARVSSSEVLAVGIANQRETAILWERASGRPVHNAIVWQCRRTAALCEALKAEGAEPEFREKTGLILDPYFSGTKIRWVLDEVPGARARAERGELAFGTVDAWLLWRLSGGAVHATDPSNASRTLCFNIRTLDWDEGLCRRLGVPTSVLPRVLPSAGVFAETAAGVLPGGIPVTGIAGDQQAALFGQACVEPGTAKNTYGTGCFALLNTGQTPVGSTRGLVTTVAWTVGHRTSYALEAIAYQSRDVLDTMAEESGLPIRALRVDGGAAVNDFLCQFQSDILGAEVLRPSVTEITGLGAAYLAGVGVGLWKTEDLAGRWKLERRFTPALMPAAREAAYAGWRRAVERSRAWAQP